jgi:nucleoside diphosphate kinase
MTRNACQDRALLVLKPDALIRGLERRLIETVGRHGYRVVETGQRWLTPGVRSALYAPDRDTGRLDWELNGRLYEFAPVRIFALERRRAGETDLAAAEYLSTSLKGHFVPPRAGRGTLRCDLGAWNPICNLVHTADNAEAVRREGAILFTGASRTAQGAWCRPSRTPLWSLVEASLRAWLGPSSAALVPPEWPLEEAGCQPSSFEQALLTFGRLTLRLEMSRPAEAETLGGIPRGDTSYTQWLAKAPGTPQPHTWQNYVTFTTLRYLTFCLEENRAGTAIT